MRVLFVAPFVPWPLDSGGRIRTYHLVREAAREVEVTLWVVREPDQPAGAEAELAAVASDFRAFDRARPGPWTRLARPRHERWFWSPDLADALARAVREEAFDLVHLDEVFLARVPPADGRVPLAQHHHKIDTVLYERLARTAADRFDLWKLRALEREAARRTPFHLTCSEEDAALLRGRYPELATWAVPSGFDPGAYRRSEPPVERDPARLLFLGTLSYGPNVDALRAFCAEGLEELRRAHPGCTLEVVGRDPVPEVRALAGPGVEVVGEVPDVRPHLERAAALVVPLRIGGGTRLKIVEALALGTPVVSTAIGAEGLGLVDGEHLLLAEDPAGVARRAGRLLADPQLARALGEAGAAHVHGSFTWQALGARLVRSWREIRDRSAAR